MRILLISHSSGFYGAEKSLLTVAKGLKDLGHDVMVVAPSMGILTKKLEENGVPYRVWKYYGWLGRSNRVVKGGFRFVFNVVSSFLFSINCRKQFDLIYTNTVTTPFGVFLSFFKRKRHIWHVREFVHEDMGAEFDLPRRFLRLIFFVNHAHTIFNSLAVSKKFNSYLGEHSSSVIYNAIDEIDTSAPKSPDGNRCAGRANLIMVSSLHPGKGHMDALRAMPHILIKYPDACLKIVGEGDALYKAELEQYINNNGLANNVIFLGYLDNPVKLMANSDVFLMCSRNEAFGRVTIEAMTSGCPVIGANSGGTSEILDENKYGLLYEPGDSKSLAERVVNVLSDNELRLSVSSAGKVRASAFSIDSMLKKINEHIAYKI